MSFTTLQRVVVRMLIDPRFTGAIFATPDTALSGLDLSDVETQWLLASDRRAWRLDPMRRTRMLQSLLEEFPVSAAITLQHDGHAERLDAFFSSPQLHEAVQTRGLLSRAFAAYLATLMIEPLEPLRAIEASIAVCRGQPVATPPPPGAIALAAAHDLLTLPTGSLERYVHFSALLRGTDRGGDEAPLRAMLTEGFQLPDALTPSPKTVEYVLVEPSSSGPRLGEVSEALGGLLDAAKATIDRPDLVRLAVALGAEPDEAVELIDELSSEGLLVPGQVAPEPRSPTQGAVIPT